MEGLHTCVHHCAIRIEVFPGGLLNVELRRGTGIGSGFASELCPQVCCTPPIDQVLGTVVRRRWIHRTRRSGADLRRTDGVLLGGGPFWHGI